MSKLRFWAVGGSDSLLKRAPHTDSLKTEKLPEPQAGNRRLGVMQLRRLSHPHIDSTAVLCRVILLLFCLAVCRHRNLAQLSLALDL